MRLEGTKSLHVEKSIINITLSGWTRTQDIGPQNVISSARLADAKLDYEAQGPLGSPKGGLLGRLLGKLWL
jgi:flagellar basal body L-ring protein FlgH